MQLPTQSLGVLSLFHLVADEDGRYLRALSDFPVVIDISGREPGYRQDSFAMPLKQGPGCARPSCQVL